MSQAQPSQTHQQAPVTHKTMQQVPLQAAGIEERLQCLANRVDQSTLSGLLPPSPAPPAYTQNLAPYYWLFGPNAVSHSHPACEGY